MSETPKSLVLPDESVPEELVLFPTHERPVFPGMAAPLIFKEAPKSGTLEFIQEKKRGWVALVELTHAAAAARQEEKEGASAAFTLSDFRPIGCVGRILRVGQAPDGSVQLLVNVQKRFSLKKIVSSEPHLIGQVEVLSEKVQASDTHIKSLVAALLTKVKELIKLNAIFSEEMKLFISRVGASAPGALTDMVASMLSTITVDELQDVLETLDVSDRVSKVLNLVHKEVEVVKVKERINKQIEEKASKQQKDFFLHEQLKAIKKELGLEKDEKNADFEKIRERLSRLTLPPDAKKAVDEEMAKLQVLDERSPEYGVLRNYLTWMTNLPWGIVTQDQLDPNKVQTVLDRDHYGMQEVKDRILEFVSVQKLKKSMKGSILCLVGPPGVGKTSLGRSVAHSLGRKFFNFSLGGMRDEAEIKGHRRTYIGAMPGKIIQALKSCESSNPVIVLDEIDKMSTSFQGDPASALLEVLDPEQNHGFLDHYLDVRFDLSRVLFICTANTLETVPAPLLDRMEVIPLSGYLLEEKRAIAKRYLLPRQIGECGLEKDDLTIPPAVLDEMIRGYARESGVRGLDQQIRKLARKIAREKATGGSFKKVTLDSKSLRKHLGLPRFTDDSPYDRLVPGIVTGLAWTSLGGSTLYIESIVVRRDAGKGGFRLSGQLGKVMEESAHLAWSYVASLAPLRGLEADFFTDALVHLHVPAGATPKDGPSAGITMALAITSLAIGRPVPKDLAMTGELTLAGYVLPIGGVREKLVAARRHGCKRVLLPEENRKDYDELPDHVRKGLAVSFVHRFEEVLDFAFGKEKSRKGSPRDSRRQMEAKGDSPKAKGAAPRWTAKVRTSVNNPKARR